MTDPKHDGGPAFPQPACWWAEAIPGMMLRDWFAGQALITMCAGEGARMVADLDKRYDGTNWAEIVANNAYNFADAMLDERSRTK